MYSVGVGKLLGNNCPKLEARAPPSSIERVGVQDVHMVLCAGDSPLLGINAKGSSLLGAEILKEMRKSDAVARYQGANVASNKALRTNLHSGYRATATMLPPEREGYELGAGLMSEAEIVFFSAHADMKSYYATGEQKRGAGSGPMSLVIGFALSAVLFVSVSWVAVKQGWIGGEEEGYGVLGA